MASLYRLLFSALCIVVLHCFYVVVSSDSFEMVSPGVRLFLARHGTESFVEFESGFYNPSDPIKVVALDTNGVRQYSITVTNSESRVLMHSTGILLRRAGVVEATFPAVSSYVVNGQRVKIVVNVRDWSNTNLFRGNLTRVVRDVLIDTAAPKITMIAYSQRVTYGGSALVAFAVDDVGHDSISRVWVSNGVDNYDAYRYINSNGRSVYLSLIAWPVKNTFFDGSINVVDKALNENTLRVSIPRQINLISRKINVNLSDTTLDLVLSRTEGYVDTQGLLMPSEKFRFINDIVKVRDTRLLGDRFRNIDVDFVSFPSFEHFRPLDGARVVEHFNDVRTYYHDKSKIGVSRNMGVLLNSRISSYVFSSNNAYMVYYGRFGSYGNLAVLGYPLGLSAVYGHLKEVVGINGYLRDPVFAHVGSTGFTFGNRLFFGILVNGSLVNSGEWLSERWVNDNIKSVLDKSLVF